MKDANAFVQDLLSHTPDSPIASMATRPEDLINWIQSNYSFSELELKDALLNYQDQISSIVGAPVSEDQLEALAGGKKLSQGEKIAIGVSVAGDGLVAGATIATVVAALVIVK